MTEEKFKGDAVLTFPAVSLAVQGQKVLKSAGFKVKLVAPPPQLGMGCDLCVEILLQDKNEIENTLKENGITVSRVLPVKK